MKVCHVSSVHPSFDVRIFHKEAVSLAKAGIETVCIFSEVADQERSGVSVLGVPNSYKRRLHRMTKHAKKVVDRAIEVNADIYHLHDPELLPHALRLKKHGAKVIYDSHEDLPRQILSKEYVPPWARVPLSSTLKIFENFVVSRIDAIVVATDSIAERFGKLNKNIVVVNNFPFIEELKKPLVNVSKERAVCYVGSIAKIRGALEIVEAIGMVKGAKLYLAGKTNDKRLHEQMRDTPGWKKVDELGFIPRDKVAEVLMKSVAGLVTLYPEPNHLTSIPIKMFEYLSAGIPIICSDFPHWKKLLLEHECALFVDPLSPIEISKAITWMIDNPSEAKEMGLRGQKIVEKKFNWESEEKKLLKLYKQLM